MGVSWNTSGRKWCVLCILKIGRIGALEIGVMGQGGMGVLMALKAYSLELEVLIQRAWSGVQGG